MDLPLYLVGFYLKISKYTQETFVLVETEDGRIKQKRLDMKSKITDNDFQYQVAKVVKWLEKGQFVVLTIKAARGSEKEDSEALKKKIEKVVAENKDIIPNESRLTIKLS